MQVISCVNPDYMSHQFDINEKMRAILIDWLIEVIYNFYFYQLDLQQLSLIPILQMLSDSYDLTFTGTLQV